VLRKAWRAATIFLKGVGLLVAIVAILGAVGVVWLIINPPFASSETGQLHATTSRDLSIEAGNTTLAVRLEARLNDNAMRTPNGQPGPPSLNARLTPTENGSVEGVRLLVAPGDATSPSAAVRETAPGRLDWTMPCPDGLGRPCRQVVLLIVEAPPSATQRKVRLSVAGDLRYPTFTPTPGWSSFDLDLRPVGPQTGTGTNPVAGAGGTVELAMGRPVVAVPLHVDYGAAAASDAAAPPAALRLSLEAIRLTETAPAGLDAPEPVRATVLAADGSIVARLGIRPGDAPSLAVALGACASGCASDYRLAFEWLDRRPDADYRVTWRAEITGLPADDRSPVSVAMRAGDPERVDPAGTTVFPDVGPYRAPRVDVGIGGLPPPGDGSSPVHVQLLVTAGVDPATEVGADVVRIEPYPVDSGTRALAVPFDVVPGESGAIVVNLDDGCPAGRCDRWALTATILSTTGVAPTAPPGVTWQLELRAWRLLPDAAPITPSIAVQ
jgi:hypothetical protein